MTTATTVRRELQRRLTEALGAASVLTSPEDLAVYSFDACSEDRLPDAAVVPADARAVATAIRIAREFGTPIVARGAGTGLCGGAVPISGGIVLSFVRMNAILDLDVAGRRARVQPGVVNLKLSEAIAKHGLFYAPDPSSQKISTIGGNVATNAGGAHTLLYGATMNHVLGIEYVDSEGTVHDVSIDDPGYDLVALLVGSEGTLGVITAIDVKLTPVPEAIAVAVGAFADVEAASAAVSAIVADGILPAAMEIMDRVIVEAIEAHYHVGYPLEAGAVLLVEIVGATEEVATVSATVERIGFDHGALSWRSATDAAERAILWASRKGAAGAVGRIAPNYYIQDAVVPRTRLPEAVAAIARIVAEHGLKVGNVFHAGDGNLHPLLLFDRRDKKQAAAIHHAGDAILHACIAMGGVISGEHGIGNEKRESLGILFNDDDLSTMLRVREVFDPQRLFNPEKIFPSGAGCGEASANTPDVQKAVAAGAWL